MMKRFLFIGLPALLAATPAFATGGFDCRTTDGSNIAMSGTIGRVVGAPLVGAHLRLGQQTLSTTDPEPRIVIARSWIDTREMRVDLADPQLERFEAELRTRTRRDGTATGTLVRDGVSHPVRCELE
jgi:hypothetical protein